ncbi:elongation factor G [Candidatus Albibeggiatoa sp. nov. NOAA]|uniref:elongation factor G n=1 Tax=Candidatus Albibeggiatoa sp. nov. NOAA TaxID=3162724 RepID=UPI0033039A39|nr:elongation factor G [Thiotrichaceae bacterium]
MATTYTTSDIHNIALVGQNGSGKTTLAEALLTQAGVISHTGTVENGNTCSDYDNLEKTHQHSLSSSILSFDHDNKHFNLIDTPGMPDFIGHAMSVFPAVETIATVINAQSGIEMVTQRLFQKAEKRNLCRMIIINKIDAPDIDLPQLVANIKETFGKECLLMNLPAENGTKVVDCFFNPEGESDFDSVADAHTQIIDQVVEVDETLMDVYLEQGQELKPEQLHDPFEKALREGHLVPICFVSARTGAGIPELMEIFDRLLPNPLEGNPRPFMIGEGEDEQPFIAEPDADKHSVAHVFKVAADPYVGKLSVFRVHQGTVSKDSQLFIGDGRKPFKVSHLFKLQGKQQIEVESAIPGDICAVAKVDLIHHDAVLHDSHDEDYIHLKSLKFPEPMFGRAIVIKRQGDEQKVSSSLQKLEEEDPCLRLEHHASLNETVLFGLGELHLRIALEKLKEYYNVEVDTKLPKIPYRETISQAAEGHHRHKKQSGGAGQFGEVFLKIKPLDRGAGFKFVDKVVGGAIPGQFIPAVEKGVQQVLDMGAIAGYPIQDVEVTVYDGKHHPVDSKEIAFSSAGKKAFLKAIENAKPKILEPIMQMQIVAPEDAMGTITGDLSAKRGRILGTDVSGGQQLQIEATCPLSELENYQTELKSMTGGAGFFSMEFSGYEPVAAHIQQQLVADFKPEDSDD